MEQNTENRQEHRKRGKFRYWYSRYQETVSLLVRKLLVDMTSPTTEECGCWGKSDFRILCISKKHACVQIDTSERARFGYERLQGCGVEPEGSGSIQARGPCSHPPATRVQPLSSLRWSCRVGVDERKRARALNAGAKQQQRKVTWRCVCHWHRLTWSQYGM